MGSTRRIETTEARRDCYTLRHILRLGLELYFECGKCEKLSRVDIPALQQRFGENATVADVKSRARCRRCKRGQAIVLMHESGRRKDWEWWPRPPGARR